MDPNVTLKRVDEASTDNMSSPCYIDHDIWIWPGYKSENIPSNVTCISLDATISCYTPFCDDFGPMNLSTVYSFCKLIETQRAKDESKNTILTVAAEVRAVTNAAFLLGAYMIMHLSYSPDAVSKSFVPMQRWLLSYCDVSPGTPSFRLSLTDCWEGLWRAKQLSWASFAPGGFEQSDYEHLDNPLNADLHEVVPGKFIAMRGPVAIQGGRTYEDLPSGARNFSPAHYADILQQYDVRVVVRLNEARYEAAAWEEEGLALADLPFKDCEAPPAAVVAKFLAIAEGAPGALAVHCKAGLGRTGTLIALYMMKHHGFTARQAMGWLRIVRPGSVIGPQQQYLCDAEEAIWAAGEAHRRRGGPAVWLDAGATAAEVSGLVAAAIAATDARVAALRSRKGSQSPPPSVACVGRDGGRGGAKGLAGHVGAAAEGRNLQRSRSWAAMQGGESAA